MGRPACTICAQPVDRGIDGRASQLCNACAEFRCEACDSTALPLLCNGKRACEGCHDRVGCPMGDEDGCCVSCERAMDCQRMDREEQKVAEATGMCSTCAMATAGSRS